MEQTSSARPRLTRQFERRWIVGGLSRARSGGRPSHSQTSPTSNNRATAVPTPALQTNRQAYNKYANTIFNLATNPTTASPDASTSLSKTPIRETERRGAGNKRRRVPRQDRRPSIHTRSQNENKMAHRRGGTPLDSSSASRPTQKRSQRDPALCRKRHIDPLLW